MRSTTRMLTQLAALALVAGLIGIPAASPAAVPFEIDTFEPLTGQAAFLGQQTAKALTAIEDYVNVHGGINGRPLKIVLADDQSSPQVAVQIASGYLAKKPAIIFGGSPSSSCNAVSGLIKDDGPVLYCYTPGVHPPPGSWIYSSGYSTVDLFTIATRYFRERGMNKIAIISTTDASGQEAEPTMAGILALPENHSVVLTTHERFGVSDISVAAQLERIRSSGAQMVIVWATGTPFGTVLRGMRDSGLTLPIVSSQGNMIYSQLESYRSILPAGTVYFPGIPVVVPEAVQNRGIRHAIDQFGTAMKSQGITKPDFPAAYAWDSLLIVVDAYRHLGFDATPAQMRDYINGVRGWQGIFGIMDYHNAPQRGVQADSCMMVRWNPDTARFVAVSMPGGAPIK
jgi:branched-chain amino acid transport system substrate-binding protein